MNYKVIDKEQYYRKGVYRHFTQDCKLGKVQRGKRAVNYAGVSETESCDCRWLFGSQGV